MEAPVRQLRRVSDGAMISGVSAGLGQYFNIDPLLVRLGWILFALISGLGLAFYLLAWTVMPDAEGRRTWLPLIVLLLLTALPLCCFLTGLPFMILGGR